MIKPSAKRPVTPNLSEYAKNVSYKVQHWNERIYECVVALSSNGILNLQIDGGSDNGEFAYFGQLDQDRINYVKGNIQNGDIILEIQNQKVAGYTQRDIVAWLNHCCRSGNPVTILAVRYGYLTKDLRQYLNSRFQKGSIDHDLQNTIRDNLYLRTVPCTTRIPRDGEVNGVDYTFLSPDEFIALEKSGNLLESGVYEGNLYGTPRPSPTASAYSSTLSANSLSLGSSFFPYNQDCARNHYGTPKPPKETALHSLQRGSSVSNDECVILPGAHPSSEGKRRRNRSNVEAMASKSVDPEDPNQVVSNIPTNSRSSTPQSSVMRSRRQSGDVPSDYSLDLGPLPDNWEKAYTETGEPYFIDHNTGNSQWLDPRLARVQKKSIEECEDDELPYGWERIDDPHYGTYYIDHVNRRTQYENPVMQARRGTQSSDYSNGGSNFWYVRNSEPNTPSTSALPVLPYNGNHHTNDKATTPAPSENQQPQSFFSPNEPPWNSPNNKEGMTNSHNRNTDSMINNNSVKHRNLNNGSVNNPNTNSESRLISSDYQHLLPDTDPSLTTAQAAGSASHVSSSPDSSPRFPYLPCIPCLNEKQDNANIEAGDTSTNRNSKSPGPLEAVTDASTENATPSRKKSSSGLSSSGRKGKGLSNGGTNMGGKVNGGGSPSSNPVLPNSAVDGCDVSSELLNTWVSHSPTGDMRRMFRGTRSHSEPRSGADLYQMGSAYSQTALSSASGPSRYRPYNFTRNPAELEGEIVSTSLIKSSRGFGFTIVGGDDSGSEEFLQIKSVVPNGPAWSDGKLKTGDVLVYVNGTCVLGLSHQDMVLLFQSIPPEETVHLEVCRGYPLPFDPEDPNNEIVTTLAVNSEDGPGGGETSPIYGTSSRVSGRNQQMNGGETPNEAMGRAAKSMPDLSVRQSAENSLAQRHNSADLLSTSDNTPDILDFNPQSSNKPEYLTVEIVKGTAGFGFTIADSAYGQKVKKILDGPRCKLLQEGDILVKINHLDLRGLSHADVVQVLKDCPCGDSAQITVQRGGSLSPSKNRGKAGKNKAFDASRKSSSSLSQSFHFPEDLSYTSGFLPPLRGAYRSKTPTADLYSSRDKEPVTFQRPKTPLVDTRNWTQSSPNDSAVSHPKTNGHSTNHQPSLITNANSDIFNSSTGMAKQMDSIYSPSLKESSATLGNARNGMHSYNQKLPARQRADENAWFADVTRTKDYPWLSRSFRDTRTLQRDRHAGFNPRNSDSKLRELYEKENNFGGSSNGPTQRMALDANGLYAADDVVSQRQPYNLEDWRRRINSSNYAYPPKRTVPSWLPDRSQVDGYDGRLNATLGKQVQNSEPFSSYFNSQQAFGNYDTTGISGYGNSGNAGNSQQPMNHFQPPESSSGYYTSAAISPHPSNTSQSLSGSQYDSLTRRKHSTSFEHEQPITSLMGQYSKDNAQFLSPYGGGIPSTNSQRLLTTSNMNSPTTSGPMEMTITLLRQESGFGFRIVGGTEEGSQVSIGHIVPGGAADLDSRLQTGDEIMSVDGASVLNTSHHHVVQLMGNAAQNGKVVLGIRRKLQNLVDSLSKLTDGIFPYDVTVTRKDNEGFGFVIISSVSRVGSTIGRIIEGSPAERCGQLRVGDRILAVNTVSILNMHHGEIVNLIKDSGFSVTLTIGAPQDDASSSTSISQRGDDQSLEHDDHYYAVELHRGLRGFGFSIRGGREFHNMPLFVLRIAEGGPAHQDSRLQVGDQIIEINGINTKNIAHSEAIEIIKQGGNSVRLLVKRGNKMTLAVVDHPSPITPTGSVGTPLSAGSSITNGPICQSSPRDVATNYEIPRDLWNYEPH